MGSDHFPISINLEITCSFFEFFSHKYNLKKVCWITFHDTLKDEQFDAQPYGDSTPFSALQAYYNLFDLIINALHKAGPKIENKPSRDHPNSPPWWNEECTRLVRLRKAKLGRYRYRCNYENFLDLSKFEATTKRTLKRTKIMGFRSYCESLSSTSKISNVWTKIRGLRHRLLSPPSPTTSAANTETMTKMKNFIERFHQFSAPPKDLPLIPSLSNSPPPSVNTLTSYHLIAPFRLQEIIYAVKNSKTKSSPGLDKINFEVIQNLPNNILNQLLRVCNLILNEGSLPEPWSKYLVFLIPKPNSFKFRPIVLASCFLKLLERLITNRLNW